MSFGCFAFPLILYVVSGQSDRKELLEQLAKEQTEHDELTKELAIYSACDPDALKAKRKKATDLRDAANRWTGAIVSQVLGRECSIACVCFIGDVSSFDIHADNIETTKSYCMRKFNMASDMINKHFGIPADLEYVE